MLPNKGYSQVLFIGISIETTGMQRRNTEVYFGVVGSKNNCKEPLLCRLIKSILTLFQLKHNFLFTA